MPSRVHLNALWGRVVNRACTTTATSQGLGNTGPKLEGRVAQSLAEICLTSLELDERRRHCYRFSRRRRILRAGLVKCRLRLDKCRWH